MGGMAAAAVLQIKGETVMLDSLLSAMGPTVMIQRAWRATAMDLTYMLAVSGMHC